MITIRAESRKLRPIITCDGCGEQVTGPGWIWVLAPTDGTARLGDAFFTHKTCESLFCAQNPEPLGWKWGYADMHEMLRLLAENTRGNAETVLVGKGSRTH
jgi:hypothetical protein